MKKVYLCGLVVLVVFLVLFFRSFVRPVNFCLYSAQMQNVRLNESVQYNTYLICFELKHCNKQFYLGDVPYPKGILDSITKIKLVGDSELTDFSFCPENLLGKTNWLNLDGKRIPCHYCKNIEEMRVELNGMTENIRGEYYSESNDAHYMYRLFCFPKIQSLPKQLVIYMGSNMVICNVNNTPKRLVIEKENINNEQ